MATLEFLMVIPFFLLIFVGVARFGQVELVSMRTQAAARHATMRQVVGKPVNSVRESRANLAGRRCVVRVTRSRDAAGALGGLGAILYGGAKAGSIASLRVVPTYLNSSSRHRGAVHVNHTRSRMWPMGSRKEKRTFEVISNDWSFERIGHPAGATAYLAIIEQLVGL